MDSESSRSPGTKDMFMDLRRNQNSATVVIRDFLVSSYFGQWATSEGYHGFGVEGDSNVNRWCGVPKQSPIIAILNRCDCDFAPWASKSRSKEGVKHIPITTVKILLLARESYLPPPRRPNFGRSCKGYGRYDFPVFSRIWVSLP